VTRLPFAHVRRRAGGTLDLGYILALRGPSRACILIRLRIRIAAFAPTEGSVESSSVREFQVPNG
jgi:hypothetical protein